MNIRQAILDLLPEGDSTPHSVVAGVHWTLVCTGSGCGLASTLTGDAPHGHERVRHVGCLEQKSTRELAGWVLSDNPLETSIGTAALNALLPVDESRAVEINAGEILAERSAGKNIAVVGHFPFVRRLAQTARNLWVIEKRPEPGEQPADSAGQWLPQADVVAITGTALMNGTIEGLLGLCRPDAFVLVLGPSTPLTPLWFDLGVSVYSGARVTDPGAARRTIQQGAVFPQVEGVRLVSFMKE